MKSSEKKFSSRETYVFTSVSLILILHELKVKERKTPVINVQAPSTAIRTISVTGTPTPSAWTAAVPPPTARLATPRCIAVSCRPTAAKLPPPLPLLRARPRMAGQLWEEAADPSPTRIPALIQVGDLFCFRLLSLSLLRLQCFFLSSKMVS
jgi:type IV secretory pathway VirB10-like protein